MMQDVIDKLERELISERNWLGQSEAQVRVKQNELICAQHTVALKTSRINSMERAIEILKKEM